MDIEERLELAEILIRFENGEIKGAHAVLDKVYLHPVTKAVIFREPGVAKSLSALPTDKYPTTLLDAVEAAHLSSIARTADLEGKLAYLETQAENREKDMEFLKTERDFYAEVVRRASNKAQEAIVDADAVNTK